MVDQSQPHKEILLFWIIYGYVPGKHSITFLLDFLVYADLHLHNLVCFLMCGSRGVCGVSFRVYVSSLLYYNTLEKKKLRRA